MCGAGTCAAFREGEQRRYRWFPQGGCTVLARTGAALAAGSVPASAEDVERRVTLLDGMIVLAVFLAVTRVMTGGRPVETSGRGFLVMAMAMASTLAYLALRRLLPLPGMSLTSLTRRTALFSVAIGVMLPTIEWALLATLRLTQGWSHPSISWWAVPPSLAEVAWIAIALRSVLVPVVEELVFRGAFYTGLRRHLRAGWAVALSAFTFAVLHPGDGLLFVLLLGVATAILYERTNSLWAAVTTHATFNTFIMLSGVLMYRWGDIPGTSIR